MTEDVKKMVKTVLVKQKVDHRTPEEIAAFEARRDAYAKAIAQRLQKRVTEEQNSPYPSAYDDKPELLLAETCMELNDDEQEILRADVERFSERLEMQEARIAHLENVERENVSLRLALADQLENEGAQAEGVITRNALRAEILRMGIKAVETLRALDETLKEAAFYGEPVFYTYKLRQQIRGWDKTEEKDARG